MDDIQYSPFGADLVCFRCGLSCSNDLWVPHGSS